MPLPKESIAVVTGNPKKYKQIAQGLQLLGIQTSHVDVDLEEMQTLDSEAIIRQKALSAYAQIQRPLVVEDGGIYFEAYDRFPGVYSKFIFGSLGFTGIEKLYAEGDAAVFRSTIAYMDQSLAQSGMPQLFTGEYAGTLTHNFENRSEIIMPYAELFVPHNSTVPMSQMDVEKRSLDHRQQSVRQCGQWLVNNR